MNIATAFVSIRADRTKLRGDLDDVKGESIRHAQDTARGMTQAFAQYFSIAAFTKGINNAIQAGSRLQQAVGATESVFKGATRTIDQFAATSAKSFGISASAARELTAQIGSLLKGVGFTDQEAAKTSVTIAKLGADLAATFGGKPEQAVEALGSALKSEFNPLERFGISLNIAQINQKAFEMGLASSTSKVDLNARAQAALALIMERSADAQGQFAREADTAAGKAAVSQAVMEDSAASIGTAFLPIYGRAVELVGFLAEGFASLPAPVQVAVIAFAGLVALAGPVGSLIDLLGKLGPVATKSLGAMAVAAIALGFVYEALSDTGEATGELNERSKAVSDALTVETDRLAGVAAAAGKTATEVDGLTAAHQTLSAALTGNDEDGQRTLKALGALGLSANDADEALRVLAQSTDDILRPANLRLVQSFLEARGVSAELSETLAIAGLASRDTGAKIDLVKDRTKGWTTEQLALVDAMVTLGQVTRGVDLVGSARDTLNAASATNEFRASLVAQAEAQAGASRNGEQAIEVYAAYNELVMLLTPEQVKLFNAVNDTTGALDDLGPAVEDTTVKASSLKVATGRAASEFDRLSDAADTLRSALDRALGGALDMEKANMAAVAASQELDKAVKANGKTLDINTEKGRANRDLVLDNVQAILDFGAAMVGTGKSNEEAANSMGMLRLQLIGQVEQFGLTRAEAEAYVDQLGLTPDGITTAVSIANDDAAIARIDALKEKLGEIPESEMTSIQALIDEGKYAAVEARLAFLARFRTANIVPGVGIADSSVRNAMEDRSAAKTVPVKQTGKPNPLQSAEGRYSDRPLLTWMSEGGRAEAVMPLTKPSRLTQMLSDSRIGGPIAEAMGDSRPAGGGGGTTVNLTAVIYGTNRQYVDKLIRDIERITARRG